MCLWHFPNGGKRNQRSNPEIRAKKHKLFEETIYHAKKAKLKQARMHRAKIERKLTIMVMTSGQKLQG
jgi:hypothetical protein